jgi:hypothetical protein
MPRSVLVSTEVFAAVWANRLAGEETEEDILRRLLGLPSIGSSAQPANAVSPDAAGGVHDARNGIHFPEGFEIFRTYKRREYVAQARGGAWFRPDNGKSYPTLNQLNASIAAGAENVWNGNWKYRATDGAVRSIADLRA